MEDRLKKFTVLIDYGSFTRAAKALHTSQPALSVSIQKLEKELGATLIVKSSKQLILTDAGKLAYQEGLRLIESVKYLKNALQQLRGEKTPLRLGCVDSIAELIVKEKLLDALEKSYAITMTVQSSSQLLLSAARQELDITIFVEGSSLESKLKPRKLGNEQFIFVQTKNYDYQKESLNFLAYNKDSATYAVISKQLTENSIAVKPKLHSTNPAILLELALQGKGAAALPSTLVGPSLRNGSLIQIPTLVSLHRPIASTIGISFVNSHTAAFLKKISTCLDKKTI